VRVLQIDSGREWRGGQNQVRLLCRELIGPAGAGLELLLATQRGSELARRAAAEGVRVAGLPWRIGLDPRAAWWLRRLVSGFGPDIIHVHDSHALTLARWARSWRRSSPRLFAHRRVDFHVRRGSGWFRVDRVVAISAGVMRVLVADGVPAPRITVIPDGIDPEEVRVQAARPVDVRARLRLPPGTPLAVNVAALVDHKDHRTLVRAAGAARAAAPDLHWAIAGEGAERRSLEAEIARLNLHDRVHLLGYVDEADALIREGNVFVMSSKEEGLGSVVLHALALEKPVVATAAGGLPEVVPEEWVVPVGDSDALAGKVVQALEHVSRTPFPERFTARAMAASVLALYRSLA
jgi:L-malate glycosyltransferase